ncbi:lipoprotein [Gammaproteobacteria bacterium]|nr:lipoprotein [Gammaproteobacteria bacterium]
MLIKNTIIGLFLAIILSGCSSSKSSSLYSWGDYEQTVTSFYQQDKVGLDKQIDSLNKNIQKAKAKELAIPPGLYAHLGMLYANTGRTAEAFDAFATEKALFPESTVFMDFLSRNKRIVK